MNPNTDTCNTQTLQDSAGYVFELFVCGMTKKSLKTIKAVKTVLDKELQCNYTLTVIDIFKNPQFTQKTHIMTTPVLIRKSPLPKRHVAGDITVKDRILCGLKIETQNRP